MKLPKLPENPGPAEAVALTCGVFALSLFTVGLIVYYGTALLCWLEGF